MKKTILLVIAGALLFCLGFQVSELRDRRSADAAQAETPAEKAAAIDEEAETSAECEGVLLPDSTIILNYKGEKISPATLSGDSTLIARFSTSACRPCVNALTASLQSHARRHPGQRIVILLKNVQLRDLYVMAPDFGPQFRLLACDSIPVDFDRAETPAIFRIDSCGRVYDHFTCRYGDYGRTDNYLQSL